MKQTLDIREQDVVAKDNELRMASSFNYSFDYFEWRFHTFRDSVKSRFGPFKPRLLTWK